MYTVDFLIYEIIIFTHIDVMSLYLSEVEDEQQKSQLWDNRERNISRRGHLTTPVSTADKITKLTYTPYIYIPLSPWYQQVMKDLISVSIN